MIRYFIFSFIILLVSLTPVVAQDTNDLDPAKHLKKANPYPEADVLPDLQVHKKTNPETVIFTQYKLAEAAPDIDNFARLSPRVQMAQDIDKSAMTISEYNRMNNKYNLLNPKEPIVVHTSLRVDEYSSLQNIMVFDELNEKTYFNFPVYNENIAIIPDEVERFNTVKISKDRADSMFENVAVNGNLMAEFVLLPSYADRREPFVIEDTGYWLMLADIAEIRLWADTGSRPKLVWYYRDAEYKPKDKDKLDTLYTNDSAQLQQ